MVQKMNGNVTCGDCWWWNKRKGECICPVPMWVDKPPFTTTATRDASQCPCFRKRWVEEI